jgi:hypothetical protein
LKGALKILGIVTCACLAAAVAHPAAAQPTVAVVDPAATVRGTPVIATGTDGLPLVAYQDGTAVRVAHCADAACSSATIATILSPLPNPDGLIAFAVGADGRGVLAVWHSEATRVLVARCDDAACSSSSSTAILETDVTLRGRPSLAIGADGLPLIAYVAGNTQPYALRVAHCSDAACASSTIATVATVGGLLPSHLPDTDVAIGTDGLALIAYVTGTSGPARAGVAHCSNTACSAATTVLAPDTFLFRTEKPSIEIGADGRGLLAYRVQGVPPAPPVLPLAHVRRCADAACTSLESVTGLPANRPEEPSGLGMAAVPGGRPWIALARYAGQVVATCTDDACSAYTETCVVGVADRLSVARGGDGQPVTAFVSEAAQPPGPAGARPLRVAHGFTDCTIALAAVDDLIVTEGTPEAVFTVRFSKPLPAAGSVTVRTRDLDATAGDDYVAVAPTVVTVPAGAESFTFAVTLIDDAVYEASERFELVLSDPAGFAIQGEAGRATIVEDDAPPAVAVEDCSRLEGDAGTAGCSFAIELGQAAATPIVVGYATEDDTATAGVDYVAATGTVTFAPGEVSKVVSVAVVGDLLVELDETFFLNLTAAPGGTLGDFVGDGTIVDDDAPSLSSLELTHGSSLSADLAGGGGPSAEADYFRFGQAPFASYEVIVDALSGHLVPGLALHRLAEDNSTIQQTAVHVGTGTALALRWLRRAGSPELRESLRLFSSACTGGCDARDVYRIRFYETTASVPRFNNSGGQATVLILQNTEIRQVTVSVQYWDAAGTLLLQQPNLSLLPRETAVIALGNPELAGLSGSITVAHDGGYGTIAGKAVALEPATGFSFDSPLVYKPR